MDFLVGTFNHPSLYTLHFDPSDSSLTIVREHAAISGHSWLSLAQDPRSGTSHRTLYCTAWTKPQPSVAAYSVKSSGRDVQFLNAKPVNALSGYVCANNTHVFSAGGSSGEVFRLEADGSIGQLVQELDFVTGQGENVSEQRGEVPHGSYGGLRHGAHSVDLSPDGRSIYISDIGRNCIWTYSVSSIRDSDTPPLKLGTKHISPRSHDGPRHTWPHPNGKVLYSLQEHSSIVDLFSIGEDGVTLKHEQGVKIIPAEKDVSLYWADEVRISTGPDSKKPQYLYASTRGLETHTMGYVAVFAIDPETGRFASEEAIHIWETPTSGGIANAIEPAPWIKQSDGSHVQYLAMTDSQEGWVFVLQFDAREGRIQEVTKLNLGKTEEGQVVQAATAVWVGNGAGGRVDLGI